MGIVGGSDLAKISEQLGPDSASDSSRTPLALHTTRARVYDLFASWRLRPPCRPVSVDLPPTSPLCRAALHLFDYVFSENGLVAHKTGALIGTQNLVSAVGDAVLQPFVNFCLRYIADLDIPVKRGTFIEFRSGMINVSPVGRNCSQQERDAFEAYDKVHGVRAAMVAALRQNFPAAGFTYSIGGQVRRCVHRAYLLQVF